MGGSRAESHISACAISYVDRVGPADDDDERPAYHDLEPIGATQQCAVSDDEEEDGGNAEPLTEIDDAFARSNVAVMRGNRERIVTTEDHTYFYGQTPPAICKREFQRFADYMDMSVEAAAKYVLDAKDSERAELLKVTKVFSYLRGENLIKTAFSMQEFYVNTGYTDVEKVYDKVTKEFLDEERELQQHMSARTETEKRVGSPDSAESVDFSSDEEEPKVKVRRNKRSNNLPEGVQASPRKRVLKFDDETDQTESCGDNDDEGKKKPKPPPSQRYQSQSAIGRSMAIVETASLNCDDEDEEEINPRPIKPPPRERYRGQSQKMPFASSSSEAGKADEDSDEDKETYRAPKPPPNDRYRSQSLLPLEGGEDVDEDKITSSIREIKTSLTSGNSSKTKIKDRDDFYDKLLSQDPPRMPDVASSEKNE